MADLATAKAKRDLFEPLAEHLNALANEVKRARPELCPEVRIPF